MEHEHSDDEYGFWEPERTRRLPRVRDRDDATRQLAVVRPGTRRHGDLPTEQLAATVRPLGDDDLGDPTPVLADAFADDLFADLGPADDLPGLDGEVPIEVVSTGRRSWRERLRRDGNGRLDPFVTRVGVLVALSALALPVAAAYSAGSTSPTGVTAAAPVVTVLDDSSAPLPSLADPTSAAAQVAPTTAVTTAAAAASTERTATAAPAAAATEATADSTTAKKSTVTTADSPAITATGQAGSATQARAATNDVRQCGSSYEILAGDYWLGIADRADVTVADLLAANDAQSSTPLYAGRTICLPAGATTPVPAPATTDAPATTAKPTTTDAPVTTKAPATTAKPVTTKAPATTAKPATTSAPVTTKAPTTTAKAPTTTAAPTTAPARSYSRDEVAQIIRDVWPDDLEDKAIAIATRESNLTPAVRNYCCFGLFQIYFNVHAGWLAGMGVTEATQLYDPVVNAKAALALYFRNGGWGPWGG